MLKKFSITVLLTLFINFLTYSMDYNELLLDAASEGDLQQVDNALHNDANINVKDDETGFTALHEATVNGYADIVRFLISKGAHINAKDSDRLTPLYRAITYEKPTMVKLLLSQPNIQVDKSYLELAKKKANEFALLARAALIVKTKGLVVAREMQKAKMDEIGRMLILHLGLSSGQYCISKKGIVGVYSLPEDIAKLIANFIHE
jgi:hypothetical protein